MKDLRKIGILRKMKSSMICEGGGFRGAFLAGNLKAHAEFCVEYGIMPAHIYGVSVAIAMLASYSEAKRPEDLLRIVERMWLRWREIQAGGPEIIFDGSVWNLLNGPAMSKTHDRLYWLLKDFDPKKSIASPICFEIAAFNERIQKQVIFSNHDQLFQIDPELLRRAAISSMCHTPHFDSLAVGNDRHYDGGYVDATRAIDFGCDTIFFFAPYPTTYIKPQPPHDLIGRHIPVLEKLRASCSAILRDRAACGLERVDERRRVAQMFEKYRQNKNAQIDELKRRLAAALEKLKEDDRGGFLSGLRGVFAKIKKLGGSEDVSVDKVLSLEEELRGIFSEENIGLLWNGREVRTYGDPPIPTLTLNEFRKPEYDKKHNLLYEGDINIALERGYRGAKKNLQNFVDSL